MKEYKTIGDLPANLKIEIEKNKSFFDNFDGKSLDEQQRIACVLNDCDLEIIAGAGTGKTQTLVAKSSYLIEKKGIDSSDILCLSFSNSSVNDLQERLIHPIETRTIHSLGLSIVGRYEDKQVFDDDKFYDVFNLYLEDASPKQLFDIQYYCENYLAKPNVKIKLNEIESDEEKLNFLISNTYIRKDLKEFVGLFKGKDYGISDLNKFKKACEEDLKGSKYFYKNMGFLDIADSVFRYYQGFLSRNNLLDFNDMINKSLKYLDEYGFGRSYKYIFVDEYQDMSYKNFQLLNAIKRKTNANLVVVGDDWQSIYGFRDSDLNLFTHFDEYFPDAKRVYIEKTYRNSQQLINAAGNFIMNRGGKFKKSLKSDLSIERPIKIIYHSPNNEEEYHTIYNLIYNLSQDNEVLLLGRHAKRDIDEFLFATDLVKKGRSRNYKKITDKYETIKNVEFRTIHKAKGLEADYAIIIQAEDKWLGFPNKLSPSYFMTFIQDWWKEDKFDEERRLFYVALTRAKKGVYIFTTKNNESEYVLELKKDSGQYLESIYSDDESTYSHLKEFKKAPKPKKSKQKNIKNYSKSKIEIKSDKKKISQEKIIEEYRDVNGIEIKANQKKIGNNLIKSKEYSDAEDFYKKLITNMYYINDYYPYRKLVDVYRKKKESNNIIKTIEEFFKSERYCNESQLLWFKFEYKKACTYTFDDFNKFDEYLQYFKDHGLKNKDKQNDPVLIAARIKIKRNHIEIISQDEHDKESEKKELELKYKFARKFGSSKETLQYFEQLWNQPGFKKNLTAYKRLCRLYEDTGQYEKVIQVANEYFESNARKTKSSPDWFKTKVMKARRKLARESISEVLEENVSHNVITVARNNFSKLLSSEIGDKITIKRGRNKIILEIINIKNPKDIYEELYEDVKISISKDNFRIVENITFDGKLIIRHKNVPGEVILRKIG